MKKTNTKFHEFTNKDQLEQMIGFANASLHRSKESAAEAAGYAYLIWLATQEGYSAKLLKSMIDDRNKEIAKFNEKVDEKLKLAADFAKSKLSIDEWMKSNKDTFETAEYRDVVREFVLNMNDLTKKEKSQLKLVPIAAREDASKFTVVVKCVFGFDRPDDSVLVNRYTLALDWLDAYYKNQAALPDDVHQIVDVIAAADGFERVVEAQRQIRDGGDNHDAKKREAMRDLLVEDVCKILNTAPAKASVNIEARNNHEGVVLLLGRKNGGTIEVIDQADLGEPDIKRAIQLYSPHAQLPYNPGSEFVSRVMRLGRLVQEGKATDQTRFGLKSGEVIKTQRMVLLLSDEDERPSMMVSAREADAAVIVRAVPKDAANLCAVNEPLALDAKARNRLDKMLKEFARRRYVELTPDHAPMQNSGKPAKSPFAWQAENKALSLKGMDGKEGSFFWHSLVGSQKPLEVDLFRPQFEVKITPQALQHLFSTSLTAWANSVSGKKSKDETRLLFEQDRITLQMKGADDQAIDSVGVVPERIALRFRPRDLHDLFEVLCEQHGDEYTIEGDDGGLLKISWEDNLAHYEVYQPLCTTDGQRLESRRLTPMRQQMPVAAE
jgi:hypothetical protein